MAVQKKLHPVDVHVGNIVRMKRVMRGISQEKLGEGLGITFQQIQKYEKGTNRISASKLWDIAQILDVAVTDFFEGLDKGQANVIAELPQMRVVDMSLYKAMAAIRDEKVKRKLLGLINELSSEPVEEEAEQPAKNRKAA